MRLPAQDIELSSCVVHATHSTFLCLLSFSFVDFYTFAILIVLNVSFYSSIFVFTSVHYINKRFKVSKQTFFVTDGKESLFVVIKLPNQQAVIAETVDYCLKLVRNSWMNKSFMIIRCPCPAPCGRSTSLRYKNIGHFRAHRWDCGLQRTPSVFTRSHWVQIL